MNIAIFNVKYSDNLGDGLIAECLERALEEDGNTRAFSIDLGGVNGYTSGRTRPLASRVIGALTTRYLLWPQGILRQAAYLVSRIALRLFVFPKWKRQLGNADAVILGGGQIFADVGLYFPVRIAGAMEAIKQRALTMAVYGCGVSEDLSHEARTMLGRAGEYPHLRYLAVRDMQSARNWQAHFSGPDSAIWPDPGFLASAYFNFPKSESRERKLIGIGVICAEEIARHGGTANLPAGDWVDFYLEAGRCLRQAGYDVVYFTNGARADEAVKEDIERRAKNNAKFNAFTFAPRPLSPAALAEIVSALDGLAAHRLHAHILAYSYKIPHIGMAWDPKMEGYFEMTGRKEFFLRAPDITPSNIAGKIHAALEAGICEKTHGEILTQAREGIRTMHTALNDAPCGGE